MKNKFDKSLFNVTTSGGTLNLFKLTLPLLFESVMLYMLGTVNTAVLSGYSENSVAAVGAANRLIMIVTFLPSVISYGTTVVLSNFIGAEKKRQAGKTTTSALVLTFIFSVILVPILMFFSKNILGLLNIKGTILAEADIYFRIRVLFSIFGSLSGVLLAILRSYGYPTLTVVSGLATNVVNLLLNIYVIYFSKYSPVTGVEGVGYACIVGQIVGLIIAIIGVRKKRIPFLVPRKNFLNYIGKILKIGIPSGVSSISFSLTQMVSTSFVALIGVYALSAQVYFSNILCYAYLFSVSLGNANALLIGRLFGARKYDHADKLNNQLIKITTLINFTVSMLIIILRKPILSCFTTNEKIIELALIIFIIDLFVEQARAISQVYEYALRAAGDVYFSFAILVVSCWVFGIGLSYVLAIPCGLGLIGCWIGLLADETTRAVVTYFRWKSGRWKK